ncbi:MAG: hypothetical protein JNL98_16395 [Bryobacterales bacterium]|nr:hypothetical protein [Bryobacterales bacterium]
MPEQHEFLTTDGDQSFFQETSRPFHSRNNDQLLLIDDALRKLNTLGPVSPERFEALLALNTRANNFLDTHTDKVGAQADGFRLPVITELQNEIDAVLDQPKPKGWQKVRDAMGKIIPKGSIAPGTNQVQTVTIDGQARQVVKSAKPVQGITVNNGTNGWMEILDHEHHRGQELSNLMFEWKHSEETCSFLEYLDRLPQEQKEALMNRRVHYVDDLVLRALFECDVEGGKLFSRMTPETQRDIMARNKDRKTIVGDTDLKPLNTTTWACNALNDFDDEGWACFVMSTYNVVYAGQHIGGLFHHSSFLCGAPVLSAGMMRVQGGTLKEVCMKTGHYRTDIEHAAEFLRAMKQKQVPLVDVKVRLHDGEVLSAEALLQKVALRQTPQSRALYGDHSYLSGR